MKNLFLILIAFASLQNAIAQPEDRSEKIEAAKIAFITKELELTTEEAQKFWPVYNEREAEQKKIRQEMRDLKKDKKMEELSDDEAMKIMDAMLNLRQKEVDIDKKYHSEFLKVLPVKKVAKLYQAEHKFKKEVMKQWKENNQHPQKQGPKRE